MTALNINKELYNKHIKEEKQPVLVEFWAPWCVYCRRIGPAFDKVAKEADGLLLAKVNIDEEPDLAAENNIVVIPTLVLFKEGQAVASITAPDSKAKIDQFIRENL